MVKQDDYLRYKRRPITGLRRPAIEDPASYFGEEWTRLEAFVESKDFQIPPLPRIAVALNRMTKDPDASLSEVFSLVERDVQMAARLMQVARSPAYAARQPPRSLRDAILRLGFKGIRSIALAVALGKVFRGGRLDAVMRVEYQHAFVVGCASGRTAPEVHLDPHEAFLCGLMHDIGRIALLSALATEGQPEGWVDAEFVVSALDAFHAEFGGLVLEQWQMPAETQAVARFHHEPERAGLDDQLICHLVSLADFADRIDEDELAERMETASECPSFEKMGLSTDALANLFEAIDEAHADDGLMSMTG